MSDKNKDESKEKAKVDKESPQDLKVKELEQKLKQAEDAGRVLAKQVKEDKAKAENIAKEKAKVDKEEAKLVKGVIRMEGLLESDVMSSSVKAGIVTLVTHSGRKIQYDSRPKNRPELPEELKQIAKKHNVDPSTFFYDEQKMNYAYSLSGDGKIITVVTTSGQKVDYAY